MRREPVQARRADGPSCQVRLQQGQGAGVEDAQEDGEVAAGPISGAARCARDRCHWQRHGHISSCAMAWSGSQSAALDRRK